MWQREAVFDCSLAGRVLGGCEECQGLPYGVSLRLPLDTGQRYRLRRNAVKGRGLPLFISTLDGEGADTLIPQGKAAASPLAPFRAGG